MLRLPADTGDVGRIEELPLERNVGRLWSSGLEESSIEDGNHS
jgi:hypothetical protein